MLRKLWLGLAGALLGATLAGSALAGEINTTLLGNAIDGYDPVAYQTMGKPVEGSADYTYDWKGATWRFASAENRDMFAADPEKYAPAYGGYCAYGVAQDALVGIDPEAWSVVDGKLTEDVGSSIAVEAGTSVKIKSGTTWDSQSGTAMTHKAGTMGTFDITAMGTVKAGGILTIMGSMVNIN